MKQSIKDKLVYPVCVVCGNDWEHNDDDGKIYDPLDDSIRNEFFCDNVDVGIHDSVDYYQYTNGSATITRQFYNLHNSDYDVRWNCNCSVKECYGKNVIYKLESHTHHYSYPEFKVIKYFDNIPMNISNEDFYKIVSKLIILL